MTGKHAAASWSLCGGSLAGTKKKPREKGLSSLFALCLESAKLELCALNCPSCHFPWASYKPRRSAAVAEQTYTQSGCRRLFSLTATIAFISRLIVESKMFVSQSCALVGHSQWPANFPLLRGFFGRILEEPVPLFSIYVCDLDLRSRVDISSFSHRINPFVT